MNKTKKITQAQSNPFPHSDTNKRYYTYDYYLRRKYGEKCAKIPLDAGLSCPNIDGSKGCGGCIYCSSAGSGDFTLGAHMSLSEQYEGQRARMGDKWRPRLFIPYLQAHTNTYADKETLARLYRELASLPDACAVHIATRADCLPPYALELLADLAEQTDLVVELGLQSVHEETAKAINRCHSYDDFLRGYDALRRTSDKIGISVHLINGLPGENEAMMLESARRVGALAPDQIKFHLLHVLKKTRLAAMYLRGEYLPMEEDAYVSVLMRQIEILPKNIVIGRLTGDGKREDLLAPLWSLRKLSVIDHLDRLMYDADTWQGKHVDKQVSFV